MFKLPSKRERLKRYWRDVEGKEISGVEAWLMWPRESATLTKPDTQWNNEVLY